MLARLPRGLSREQKMACVQWFDQCYCCPSQLNFGHCLAAYAQAIDRNEGAEVMAHWGGCRRRAARGGRMGGMPCACVRAWVGWGV